MKLIISVHLEYMSVERVVELVKRYSLPTHLHITLMFHPEFVEKAMAVADTLCGLRREYPFEMSVSMLREPPKFDKFDSRYTQEHFDCAERIRVEFGRINVEDPKREKSPVSKKNIGYEFLVERNENGNIENYERISFSELKDLTGNAFTGMTCCAGVCLVKIFVDGRVEGTICGWDGTVCNIFEENPFLREDWMHGVLCTHNMCGCNLNYRIPKFRSPAEAQKFIAKKRLEQKKLMRECQDNNRQI